MKRFIAIFIIFLFGLSIISAEEIPIGVSATKIVIDGSIDIGDKGGYEFMDGLPGFRATGEPYDGKWDGINMDSIEYTLTFWNVGEMGGTSGMLFWKKNYADAVLTIRYNPSNTGVIYKFDGYLDKKTKSFPFYKIETPKNPPEFRELVYRLKFSGGPSGTFTEKEPVANTLGKALIGQVHSGVAVTLKFPTMENTGDSHYSNHHLVNELNDETLSVPGNPFFGWVIEEEACVDSGARFSAVSKEVDIFPDSNPDNLRSANPHSVLCVHDHIMTGEESSAIITFPDLSTIMMKEESEIVIASPPKEKTRLEVLGGTLKMNIKKVLAGEQIEVKSNLATCGIKGTTFIFEVKDDKSTLKVIEGTVEFTSEKDGTSEIVTTGEEVIATTTSLDEKTTFDVKKEEKSWSDIEKLEEKETSGYTKFLWWQLILGIIGSAAYLYWKKNPDFHKKALKKIKKKLKK
ncbi:MAG: FecR family protein [archaeon]